MFQKEQNSKKVIQKEVKVLVTPDSATPWTVVHHAPLSMEFSRQEYWEPLPPPGDLPDPGMEPRSPALQADSFPSEQPGKPAHCLITLYFLNFLPQMLIPNVLLIKLLLHINLDLRASFPGQPTLLQPELTGIWKLDHLSLSGVGNEESIFSSN